VSNRVLQIKLFIHSQTRRHNSSSSSLFIPERLIKTFEIFARFKAPRAPFDLNSRKQTILADAEERFAMEWNSRRKKKNV
jgi:hypothetical protein